MTTLIVPEKVAGFPLFLEIRWMKVQKGCFPVMELKWSPVENSFVSSIAYLLAKAGNTFSGRL